MTKGKFYGLAWWFYKEKKKKEKSSIFICCLTHSFLCPFLFSAADRDVKLVVLRVELNLK